MKFLLFFVSFIFSLIFYVFHNLTIWKDILWNSISNSVELLSLSSNLLIESFIFLLIGIFFIYLFSDFKNKWNTKLINYKLEIAYFLFYIYFISYIYFFNNWININILLIIIIFILSDISFNYISNIKSLEKFIIKFRYLWLILNYISSLLSIYYISINGLEVVLLVILIFNIIFNFLIHKKYINYISLLFSILVILFLLYNLYLFIFELYIYNI